MKIIAILFLIAGLGYCSYGRTQPNSVYIDQIGNSNQISISQDGTGHVVGVAIGTYLPTNANDLTTGYGIGTQLQGTGVSEYNLVNIQQQGPGTKTATVEIPSGSYNNVTMFQDGTGNHTASIQNLNGNNNNAWVSQTGSGNHSFNVVAGAGTTNSNDTITATQSGSGDKSFTLNLNGSNGASVTVQQTNSTQSNAGSMTIQCTTCGAYSYTRQ
jgi:hypothetical protein